MPTWSFTSFQDAVSPSMEQLTFFHDHSMIILTMITMMTMNLMFSSTYTKNFNKNMLEGHEIETIWTILPAFLLVFIAMPSMKILYLMEESKEATMTMKAIGHQWYWSHEQPMKEEETDMFMEPNSTIRLLKCSESITIPAKTQIRVLVTSADVIHSWTIPSMGVKADASPGRLNQLMVQSKRTGLFSGQCSEICGANHSFMPIMLEVVHPKKFTSKA